MNLRVTARLCGMSIIAFLFVSMATAQKLPFDSIKGEYTNAVVKVDLQVQKLKDAVGVQYSYDLKGLKTKMEQNGDLQGYKLVEKEITRFDKEKTIDGNNAHPDVVSLVASKKKELESIDFKSKQAESQLMSSYVDKLSNLVKSLMIQKKISEAEVVDAERVAYTKMLADLKSGIPQKETVTPVAPQPKETLSSWKDITSTFEGGKRLAVGTVLQGTEMKSKSSYRPPVEIEYVCKTDSNNIRFSYACSFIFNWECDMNQLRIGNGPAAGLHRAGAGRIPANQFIKIRQVVLKDKMEIYVDDELRGSWDADFSEINEPIIFRSPSDVKAPIITVRSVRVRVPASKEVPSEKINLAGKWNRNVKNWDFELNANGTFTCINSKDTGTWKVNGKNLTMHWFSGTTFPDRSYRIEGDSKFTGDQNGLGNEVFTRVEEKETSSVKDSKKTSVPADAKEYKGHHYLVGEKKLTWTEAKLDAEKRGGHLVIIKDKEEQDFVISFLLKAGIRFVWIGAEHKNLRWQWVDGTSFDSNMWANKIKPKDSSNPVLFLDTSEGIKGSKNNVDGWYVIEWDE
jgi:hypothetical protein